ncbi:hypothetical protein SLS63_002056 [Diaporthe eres]|uniref:Uncharacterized protein n=1 Tax=Diaporthe eres TaxID=83184 RepID=A0ABR1PK67_DIAER
MGNKKLSENELKKRKKIAKDRIQRTFNSGTKFLQTIDSLTAWDDQISSTRSARRIHELTNQIVSGKLKITWFPIDGICSDLVTIWSMLKEDTSLPNSIKKHKGLDLEWYNRIVEELLDAARGAKRRYIFFDARSNNTRLPLKKLPPECHRLYDVPDEPRAPEDTDAPEESARSNSSPTRDETDDATGSEHDSESEHQTGDETDTKSAPGALSSQTRETKMASSKHEIDLTGETETEGDSRKRKRHDGNPDDSRRVKTPTGNPFLPTKKSEGIPASASPRKFKRTILDKNKPFGDPFTDATPNAKDATPNAKDATPNAKNDHNKFWRDKYLDAKLENQKWAKRSNEFETAHKQLETERQTTEREIRFLKDQHNEDLEQIQEQKAIIDRQKTKIDVLTTAQQKLVTDFTSIKEELEELKRKPATEIRKDLDDYTKNQIAGLKATAQAIIAALAHVEIGKTVELEVADVTKYSTLPGTTRREPRQTDTNANNANTDDNEDEGTHTPERNNDDADRESSTGILECPE